MRNDFESNYLAHHGILGQKWGVKNGPPYPIDQSSKSSSEKKETFHLTDKQKKYIAIGTAAAAVSLAAYGTYKLGGPRGVAREINSIISSGKNAVRPYMKMNLNYFSSKKSKTKKLSKKEMEVINELGRKSFRGSNFQTRHYKDLSASKAERIAMEAVRLNRKVQVSEGMEIVTYPYGNHIYYIATDVPNGRIVGRQFIPDSISNVKLPDVLPKISKETINGRKNKKT